MERFFGFDLGDAESAVSVLKKGKREVPAQLTVRDAQSFISAYARTDDGKLLIGEEACYSTDATERRLRFKSRFLTDRASEKDVRAFAGGVLGVLYENGDLVQGEDACMYIGCPAGWDRNARERYRRIFEGLGYPPTAIISESRAALVAACQSRNLQVGYDILAHPVLVVDIGSSTTDFAYVEGGKEVKLKTAGEVFLGGGIMDQLILEYSLAASKDERKIREVFEKSEPWRSYSEFAARRLKEKYFTDEDYWSANECIQTVPVYYDRPLRLTLRMDAATADRVLTGPTSLLKGRSFKEVFMDSLRETKKAITGAMPDLIFLTGGVSRLPRISDWCREVYPDATLITEMKPEFSVSRGLAYCGRIDEDMRDFMKDLGNFIDSSTVERIVSENIDGLYMRAVDTLTAPIVENAVIPVIDRWRSGGIARLADIDAALQEEIESYLHTDAVKEMLSTPVAEWLRPVAFEIEEHTMPICLAHSIPYRALSLSSYLSASELGVHLDTKSLLNVEETTWMINTIITVVVSLLCGGSGMALIASGLPGVVAGAVISLMILFLGKRQMQKALMNWNVPVPMRKLMPKSYFRNHLEEITDDIRAAFYESLEKEKNQEISTRMVEEITTQIEKRLLGMAKVVEIPLGK